MKSYIIIKVRKELDHYQANTWRLVQGYFDQTRAENGRKVLIASLSFSEMRAGWTYEIQEVDILDLPPETKNDTSPTLS